MTISAMLQKQPQAEKIVQDARRLAEDVSSLARGEAQELSRAVRDDVDAMTDQAAQAYQQAKKTAKKKAQEVDTLAHEKPWAAVGIAAALGVVVGAILTRRK